MRFSLAVTQVDRIRYEQLRGTVTVEQFGNNVDAVKNDMERVAASEGNSWKKKIHNQQSYPAFCIWSFSVQICRYGIPSVWRSLPLFLMVFLKKPIAFVKKLSKMIKR